MYISGLTSLRESTRENTELQLKVDNWMAKIMFRLQLCSFLKCVFTCSNSNCVLNDDVTPEIRLENEKLPAPKLWRNCI